MARPNGPLSHALDQTQADVRSGLVLSRLYAILDAERLGERRPEDVCRALLDAGVLLFQYRDKRGTSREMFEAICALIPIIRQRGGLLIVNDRADVARVASADGVHLGQADLPAELARRVLEPGQWLGYSTHNLKQLRQADASTADYVAYGPIFSTASKDNPDPTVGLKGLAQAREVTSKPLVAIGGITVDNARKVIENGADSVAVISALLSAPNLTERAREFLRALGD